VLGEKLRLAKVVVWLLVAVRFAGFGLIVGIEDHTGKSTGITIFTPPAWSEHRSKAVGASAGWRLARESGFEPWYGTTER
jgi:hypothetical protein